MAVRTGGNLPLIKEQNATLIKEIIYKYSPISRSEIAEALSLTPPTITTNVNALIREGLVRECTGSMENGHTKNLGRRPVMLEFIPDSRYTLGIELGPYCTTFAIVDMQGNETACLTEAVADLQYQRMLDFVISTARSFLEKNSVSPEKTQGVGIGLPGFIEAENGVIRNCYRGDWNGHHFADDISKALGLKTCIENNVHARAIGAEIFNRNLKADTFLYYFISYGLACSLVIKSDRITGRIAGAGEIGHMVVEPGGPKCDTCGNFGCLEAIASEHAIIKRCIQMNRSDTPGILREICADPSNPRIDEILKAQSCGDRLVGAIIQDAVKYLGINLANLINFISPQAVLIDSYIMSLPENSELMLQRVKKNLFGLNNQEVIIDFMPYNALYGARGAAAVAIKRLLLGPQIQEG
ncbi:MAG: ROK family transcriptional regulator [Treponema sp.]|nr:ROK family transcriptional regulator [Treponema sp.]